MKNTLLIISTALIALFSGFLLNQQKINSNTSAVPIFSFIDITGKTYHSSEWQNKWLLINFWAVWCVSCRTEMPQLNQLQTEYPELTVLGISIDNEKELIKPYLIENKINYTILIGGDSAINLSQQLGNSEQGIPFTLLINPQGQIRYRQAGEFIKQDVTKILAEELN